MPAATDKITRKKRKSQDIAHLQKISRALLKRLEEMLKRPVPTSAAKITIRRKEHELLFGVKSSLASALRVLTDLLLLLETADKARSADVGPDTPLLAAADVALAEAFVRKIKTPPESANESPAS